jgi:hypothetical protein
VNLKQVGLLNDPAIVSSTISSLLAQTESGMNKPKEYILNDISINPDKSVAALKQYGNVVGMLLKTYSPATDDATLALAGLQKKNPTYKEEIGANLAKYKIILVQLLTISVPQNVSSYHLNLVNGASDMIFISSALQSSETDPIRAVGALKLYSTAYPLILENVLLLRNILASTKITYANSDGGSFFKLPTQ